MADSKRGERRVHPTVQASAVPAASELAHRAGRRPVLVVMAGPDVGQRFEVRQGLIIGRDPLSGAVLSDPMVSSMHARIEDRGDDWALVDLGSTNGTFVEGARIQERILVPEDKISLGSSVLSFDVRDSLELAYDAAVEQLWAKDDLSGLLTRRKFDADLSRLVEVAAQTGSPLGLLAMDLDGVKRINDTHGHLFGAYVIAEAGRIIGRVLGDRGIACRFGGDEYLAALPNHGLEQASAVGWEVQKAIQAGAFQREGIALHPGISVGVAAFPASAGDAQALFQRADEALYRAKAAGKNTVMI